MTIPGSGVTTAMVAVGVIQVSRSLVTRLVFGVADPSATAIATVTLSLKTGAISNPLPTAGGPPSVFPELTALTENVSLTQSLQDDLRRGGVKVPPEPLKPRGRSQSHDCICCMEWIKGKVKKFIGGKTDPPTLNAHQKKHTQQYHRKRSESERGRRSELHKPWCFETCGEEWCRRHPVADHRRR